MTKIRAPRGLSKTENAMFRAILKELEVAGIEANGRILAIKAFVEAETRVAELRAMQDDGRALQAHRAITRLQMEQRRLRAEIFERPKASESTDELTPEQRATVEGHREADAAYRAFDVEWQGRERTAAYRAAERAMDQRHGPWPWSVLCYPTFDDAVVEGWSVGLPIPDELLDRSTLIRNQSSRRA